MKNLLRPLVAAVAALLTASLCSCSDTAGTPQAPPMASSLQQALSWIPAQVPEFQFVDMAAAKKRWGLSQTNGTTPVNSAAWREYSKKLQAANLGSSLDIYDGAMADWGWTGADVDWEAMWTSKSGDANPPVTVDKMRDGLDMQVVIKSLKGHKFTETGSGDALRFDRPMADAGNMPIFLQGVTVMSSKHIMITTYDKAFAIPATGSSLATKADIGTLVGTLPAVDYLSVTTGTSACLHPEDIRPMTPSQVAAISKEMNLGILKPITASAVAITDDTHATVRTRYADAKTAAADLSARKALLAGKSLVNQQPYQQLFGTAISVTGKTMTYQLTVKGTVMVVGRMIQSRDTPWAYCA
ncbi:MAG: hypothetical protein ACR2P2_02935 [Nakamurella sp.]